MKISLVAVVVCTSAIAGAQNFPEIPPNWLQPMTPRMIELSERLQQTGLVHRYPHQELGRPFPSDLSHECWQNLALVSATLAVSTDKPLDAWTLAWIESVPLVETLLKEIYGDMDRYAPFLVKTIANIKDRCAKLGIPIDSSRFQRFSDVPVGHWADEAIHILRETGIIRGFPDNTFRG
jgi:hypothetical protein